MLRQMSLPQLRLKKIWKKFAQQCLIALIVILTISFSVDVTKFSTNLIFQTYNSTKNFNLQLVFIPKASNYLKKVRILSNLLLHLRMIIT